MYKNSVQLFKVHSLCITRTWSIVSVGLGCLCWLGLAGPAGSALLVRGVRVQQRSWYHGHQPPEEELCLLRLQEGNRNYFCFFFVFFLGLLWYQCSCLSSLCPHCFLREDLSKTTVWRSSQVLRWQPMKKNGNRGEYSSSTALNWAIFLFRCSSSFFSVFVEEKSILSRASQSYKCHALLNGETRCLWRMWQLFVFTDQHIVESFFLFVFFNHHLHLPCLTRETNASDQKSKLENVICQL